MKCGMHILQTLNQGRNVQPVQLCAAANLYVPSSSSEPSVTPEATLLVLRLKMIKFQTIPITFALLFTDSVSFYTTKLNKVFLD